MKKNFYLSLLSLTVLFFAVSCSDDDDPISPPTVNPEVAKVINALEDIDGVSYFTKVLAENALGIDAGEDNITVFAVKDTPKEPKSTGTSTEEVIGKDNIKRHIVKGVYDLSGFVADSVVVVSLSGDPVAITKEDGKIYINGSLLDAAEPSKAGDNLIYVVDNVVPDVEIPAHKATFAVYEINEEWAEGADEKALSDSAVIEFFRYVDDEYVKVAAAYSNKGEAVYNHYYADNLFYTVKKANKSSLFEGYLVAGLFTTQEQLDNAPEYKTETALDSIALGKLRIADINGDNIINSDDKAKGEYLRLDIAADKTDAIIVSDNFGVEEPETGE